MIIVRIIFISHIFILECCVFKQRLLHKNSSCGSTVERQDILILGNVVILVYRLEALKLVHHSHHLKLVKCHAWLEELVEEKVIKHFDFRQAPVD